MQVLHTIEELKKVLPEAHSSLGFVPTMGFLHEGHLQLVRKSQQLTQKTIVSIFVNPLQFNDPKDFEKYPRDNDKDCNLLASEGVDYVFMPTPEMLYPQGFQTKVMVSDLSTRLEGKFRPGHFDGVTTVVQILFNIVRPTHAIFGEKDFQQLTIIKKMVSDLKIPVQIISHEIVREPSGLAMSSRNARLSEEGKKISSEIFAGLTKLTQLHQNGCNDTETLREIFLDHLNCFSALSVEHIEIVDVETLLPILKVTTNAQVVTAVFNEDVRLIDTVTLKMSS